MVGANQGFNQVRVLRNPSHIQGPFKSITHTFSDRVLPTWLIQALVIVEGKPSVVDTVPLVPCASFRTKKIPATGWLKGPTFTHWHSSRFYIL